MTRLVVLLIVWGCASCATTPQPVPVPQEDMDAVCEQVRTLGDVSKIRIIERRGLQQAAIEARQMSAVLSHIADQGLNERNARPDPLTVEETLLMRGALMEAVRVLLQEYDVLLEASARIAAGYVVVDDRPVSEEIRQTYVAQCRDIRTDVRSVMARTHEHLHAPFVRINELAERFQFPLKITTE